jgi:hypothetical protein
LKVEQLAGSYDLQITIARTESNMTSVTAAFIGTEAQSSDYAPLLKWILVNVLAAFGILVLWYFGLLQTMLATDRTHISLVILGIFVATSLHCLYQTIIVSQELIAVRKVRNAIATSGGRALSVRDGQIITAQGEPLERSVVTTHIADLISKARGVAAGHFDQTLLLRSLADQLRSRETIGWFVSESLLRLALLGTAVGFILMLIPVATLDSFEVDTLRRTLTGMTRGMAIALNVTVTGISTALFLKLTYYLLDEAIGDLFREVTKVTEVYVIPTLTQGTELPNVSGK